jgi:hypothetical protein
MVLYSKTVDSTVPQKPIARQTEERRKKSNDTRGCLQQDP